MTSRILYLISCIATLSFVVSCQDAKQNKGKVLTVDEISAQEYARLAADSCNNELVKDPKYFSDTGDQVTVRTQTKEIKFLNFISESGWKSDDIWSYMGYSQLSDMHILRMFSNHPFYTLAIDGKSGEIFNVAGGGQNDVKPAFCSRSDLFAVFDDLALSFAVEKASHIYIWRKQADNAKVIKVGELPLLPTRFGAEQVLMDLGTFPERLFVKELIWIDSCTLITQVYSRFTYKVTRHLRIHVDLNACQHAESAPLFVTPEEWNKYMLKLRFEDTLHKAYLEGELDYFNPQIPIDIGVVSPKRDTISIFADAQGEKLRDIYKQDQELLIPLFNSDEHNIFYLSVSGDCGDYYEVYANAQKKVYVLKSDVEFIPLNELLKRSLYIDADEAYHSKGDSSSVVSLNYSPIVVSVYEDWVEVIDQDSVEEGDAQGEEDLIKNDSLPRYWVRWRKDNRMLYSLTFVW